MKRMWILPGIYNSSMTQISLKSAVQNSIWHTASARAPGHASLEGINGTLGQLGHFDARNHLLETTWLLHMIHLTLNMNYCVILKESHKKHRKMKCRDSKWFAANETKLEMHLWRARKKKKLVLCRRSLVQFSCNAKHLSDSIRWLWEIVVSAIIVIQIPYLLLAY